MDKREYSVEALKNFYNMCLQVGEKPAVVDNDGERITTHEEFIKLINSIAKKMKDDGIMAGDVVILCLGRNMEHFAARIASFFIGAVFASVNTDYPENRKNEIIKSCNPKLIIDSEYINSVKVGVYESQIDEKLKDNRPGYIVYTSGTTGEPKGVLHSRSLFYIIDAMNDAFGFDNYVTVYAVVADMMFALSEGELYPLFFGATGHILSDSTRKNPIALKKYFVDYKVDFAAMLPSLLRFLAPIESLKAVYIVGERNTFDFSDINTKVIDFYGSSEACAMSYGYVGENIGIGCEYHSSRVFLMDEDGNEIEKGDMSKTGEVCYSGPAVMLEYIADKELTDKTVSIDSKTGMRMLHTRDSARYNKDGSFTVFGRMDSVVKIRGCRVDMSEVEYRLMRIAGIREAAVKCFDDIGENYLCAYYTTIDGISLENDFILNELKKSVPLYMIPSFIFHVKEFARNLHGKIDKNSFFPPEKKGSASLVDQVKDESGSDSNEIENMICGLFSRYLNVKNVNKTDSFSAWGGSSLVAIKMQIEIEDNLHVNISAAEIIRLDTPQKIAEKIIELMAKIMTEIERTTDKNSAKEEQQFISENDKVYPIINVAGRMYERIKDMQAINDKRLMSYHTPVVISSEGLSLQDIKNAVYSLTDTHPMLKAKVVLCDDKSYYKRRDSWQPDIKETELDNIPDEAFFVSRYRSFNIPEDDLFRVEVFYYKDSKFVFFDIHHLLIDGYSMWILLRDLKRAFEGEILMPEKKTVYDSVDEVLERQNRNQYEQSFFRNLLGNKEIFMYPASEEAVSELPVYGHVTGTIAIPEFADKCAKLNVLQSTVFLCSCMRTFCEGSRQKSFILPFISLGRKDADLIRTVGCLYEILPAPYDAADCSFVEDLQKVEESMKLINAHDFIFDAYPEYSNKLGASFNYLADYELSSIMAEDVPIGNINIKRLPPPEQEFANMPIAVEIYKPMKDIFLIDICYNKQLYTQNDMEAILNKMINLMNQCFNNR